jgi:hypothetical protein
MKPFIFDHWAVLAGGFDAVAATWRQGPHVSPISLLSLLSSLFSLLSSPLSPTTGGYPPPAPLGDSGARARPARSARPRRSSSSLTRQRCTRQSSSSPPAFSPLPCSQRWHGAMRQRCTAQRGTIFPPPRATPPPDGTTCALSLLPYSFPLLGTAGGARSASGGCSASLPVGSPSRRWRQAVGTEVREAMASAVEE